MQGGRQAEPLRRRGGCRSSRTAGWPVKDRQSGGDQQGGTCAHRRCIGRFAGGPDPAHRRRASDRPLQAPMSLVTLHHKTNGGSSISSATLRDASSTALDRRPGHRISPSGPVLEAPPPRQKFWAAAGRLARSAARVLRPRPGSGSCGHGSRTAVRGPGSRREGRRMPPAARPPRRGRRVETRPVARTGPDVQEPTGRAGSGIFFGTTAPPCGPARAQDRPPPERGCFSALFGVLGGLLKRPSVSGSLRRSPLVAIVGQGGPRDHRTCTDRVVKHQADRPTARQAPAGRLSLRKSGRRGCSR